MFAAALLFILLIRTLGIDGRAVEFGAESLYSPSEPITILSANNFADKVYGQDQAVLVEFYSSWCGACINYAAHWSEFAKKVESWSSVVKVAALNCGLDTNTEICRSYGIEGYPTVRFMGRKSEKPSDAQPFEDEQQMRFNDNELVAALAEYVAKDWNKHRLESWPSMQLIDRSQNIQELTGTEATKLEVVVSAKAGNLGYALMLDFVSEPRVRVFVAPLDHPWFKPESDSGWQADHMIAVYDARDFTKPLLNAVFNELVFSDLDKVRSEMLNEIQLLLASDKRPGVKPAGKDDKLLKKSTSTAKSIEKAAEVKSEEVVKKKEFVKVNPYKVYMDDMTTGLHYMFTHEIALKQSITGEQNDALLAFVQTLYKYFPGTPPVRRLMYRVYDWLRLKPQHVITGEEWVKQIDELQAEFGHPLAANNSYVSCAGSELKYRGYPCSLWTTFHVLTVQAYKKDGATQTFDALQILQSIAGFVKHFFTCAECVENFGKGAAKLEERVHKPADVILWLWQSHNKANDRLVESGSTDPQYPKVQFPPPMLCPHCQKPGDGSNIDWNEDAVLEFMQRYYSDISLTSSPGLPYRMSSFDGKSGSSVKDAQLALDPQFKHLGAVVDKDEQQRHELAQAKDEETRNRWRSAEGRWAMAGSSAGSLWFTWSLSDWSLCISVWLVCITLVIAICIYINYNRNKTRFWKRLYYYSDYKVY